MAGRDFPGPAQQHSGTAAQQGLLIAAHKTDSMRQWRL